MKILNLSVNDWANFAYDNSQSLNAIGHSCVSVVLQKHRFVYEKTSRVVTKKQIIAAMPQADCIQIFHSAISLAPILSSYRKPIIVYYTGTSYRQDPKASHRAFDSISSATVCALPELYVEALKHIKDPIYMVGGTFVPEQVSFLTPNKLRIAHYPSNPKVKGTETFRPLFNELLRKCHAHISTDIVDYRRQIQRIENCDVYVEMMAAKQGICDYGSFGITALEAAARGKIVLTNCIHDEIYTQHYGESPFLFCNTLQELRRVLEELIDSNNIQENKRYLHELFISKHSYAATGKYIQDNVLSRIS